MIISDEEILEYDVLLTQYIVIIVIIGFVLIFGVLSSMHKQLILFTFLSAILHQSILDCMS
jgi:hypothetical protein